MLEKIAFCEHCGVLLERNNSGFHCENCGAVSSDPIIGVFSPRDAERLRQPLIQQEDNKNGN